MNFLFFAGGSYIGGMEIVVQSLMTHLNRLGHQTLAIVSGWNNGDYPSRLRTAGLPFEEVKLGRFYRSKPLWTLDTLKNLPAAVLKLRRIARDFRADWAIYPDPQLVMMGALILPPTPAVLYEHNDRGSGWKPRTVGMCDARLRRVICVSKFVAAGIRSAGFDPNKIDVVHNGIELPPERHSARPVRPVTLGIVGQVLPRKRHLLLVRAIDALRARALPVEFRLKIIGNAEGQYSDEVRELVRELKLESVVEWTGFFASRDDIYRELDVVVAPAVDEPFGTTVLEASAYGLPVVAARSGGFPEMVVDGKTGLLFDADVVTSLADALAAVISDGGLRDRLGQAAREHVSRVFSPERTAVRFAEVLSLDEKCAGSRQ